jgi:predicted membrane channel-forming protein YqfA (hemolysin III family)
MRPILFFLLITLASLTLQFLPSPWAGWVRDGCEIANCYCETPRPESFVIQPIATYSNLGFVLVGLLIIFSSPTAFLHRLTYGSGLIAIGFGSGFYHVSLTRVGEWFDLVGIYVLVGLMVMSNLTRLKPLSPSQFLAGYVTLVVFGGVQMAVAPQFQQVMFGALIVAALVLEALAWRRPSGPRRFLLAGLGVFAVGVAVWVLDGRLLPCQPDGFFQWHAVWHTLAALAAGLLFLYYRGSSTHNP